MKKLIMGLVLGMVLFGAASTALAEIETSGDAYIGVYSKYLWRGIDVLPDNDYSIQTGADVSFGGFSVGYWSVWDEKKGTMIETDWTLDYSHDFGEMLSASIGNIMYTYDGVSTSEAYLTGTLNTLLSPSLAFYLDYHRGHTLYATLGISHDLTFGEKTTLGLGAQISYNDDIDKGYFNNIEIPVNLSFAVSDLVSIDASFLYSGPLSDYARSGKTEPALRISDEYVGGLSATLAF